MPLRGGSSAGRWKLDTDRGRWLVKTLRPPADWQLCAMRVSGTLERAAATAGVSMAVPVEPRGDAVGYWARLDEDVFARVCTWVDVAGPTVVDPELATWAGATLAAINRLELPGDPAAEAAYPVHPVPDWSDWLATATAAGVLTDRQARALLRVVTKASRRVHAELAAGPRFHLAHRDVSRTNILLTSHGPVLVDFDHAGPEVPWWEVVHQVFNLAWDPGRPQPAPHIVRAALEGYLDAGGTPGRASAAAFTGMLAANLAWLAYNLWLATGLRPCSASRRVIAAGVVQDASRTITTIVTSTDRWIALLG
ncbi:aminoglycoside phosphotransferase family protein [Amycolatopsis taiwanensis]|nr:aminoglycoside phosphotransferase family protein [Amycolatopsis taiwanensis]